MQVKDNQPTLNQTIQQIASTTAPIDAVGSRTKGRNRDERRTVTVFDPAEKLACTEWHPHVAAIVRVERKVFTRNVSSGLLDRSTETAFYVSRKKLSGWRAKVVGDRAKPGHDTERVSSTGAGRRRPVEARNHSFIQGGSAGGRWRTRKKLSGWRAKAVGDRAKPGHDTEGISSTGVGRRRPVETRNHSFIQGGSAGGRWRTNKTLTAVTAADAIRGHWKIETTSHYSRDVTFGEDKSRIRTNPGVFARLRSFAFNILKSNKTSTPSQDRYRAALAGIDNLLEVLVIP